MPALRLEESPSVAADGAPSVDYNTTQAPIAAFGGATAQAEGKLGADVSQAGQNVDQIAILQQERHNQIATDDAFNQFQAGADKLTYGDPTNPAAPQGLYTMHGADALTQGPLAVQSINKLRDDIKGGLQNDAQKLQFDEQSRRLLQYKSGEISRHLSQQSDVYALATNEAKVNNSAAAAGNAWNSEDAFLHNRESAREGSVKIFQTKYGVGLSPDLTQEAIRTADTKVVRERVLNWANTDPVAAQNWLKTGTMPQTGMADSPQVAIKDAIDPMGYTELIQHLNPRVRSVQAAQIGELPSMAVLPTGPVADKAVAAAKAQGLDPGVALTTANIESGMGTLPDRPGSQYQGVFQMGDAAWAARGGTAADRGDVDAQVNRGVSNLVHSQDLAQQAIGRKPDGWQTYMVHQQGDAGGPALLKADPNTSAVAALTPAYGGNAGQARAAVVGNGGTPDSTVGQFLQHWRQTYASHAMAAPNPAAGRPTAFGDSIAVGAAKANGFSGGGKVGASPDDVLDQINASAPGSIAAGTPVVLSSGLSNDPTKLAVVQQQIDSLKARGVSDIRLVGVGTRPDLAPVNDQLQTLAAQNGATFVPLQKVGADGVHPSDYTGLGLLKSETASKGPEQQQPVSPADQYRLNRSALIDQARAQATALAPDDPQFVELAVAHRTAKIDQAIRQQDIAYHADNDAVYQAANGDLEKGVHPTTIAELRAVNPQVAAAWDRMQVQQPQAAHAIATRILTENARDGGGDQKTFGHGFIDVFNDIHAGRITDASQLYPMVGQPGGLTMAGLGKARDEIAGKHSPEGEAETHMRTEFFKVAHDTISGRNDTFGIRDPKGEEIYLRFMAHAYKDIDAGKKAGKSASELLDPDSPDYVGKSIPAFKRTLAQKTADMNLDDPADVAPKPAEQPGLMSRIFGSAKPDLTTREGVQAAYRSGHLTREEAAVELTSRGLAGPSRPVVPPAAAVPLPSRVPLN